MNEILSTLKEIVDTDKCLKDVLCGREVLLDQQLSKGFNQYMAIRQGEYHPGVTRLRVADYDRCSLESMIQLRLDAYNEFQDDPVTYLAFILQQLNEPSIFNISLFGPMRVNIQQLHDYSFEDEDLSLAFLEKIELECLNPGQIGIDFLDRGDNDDLDLTGRLINRLFYHCRTPYEAYTLALRIVKDDFYLKYKSANPYLMTKFKVLDKHQAEKEEVVTKFSHVEKGQTFSVKELMRQTQTFIDKRNVTLSERLVQALDWWIYGTKY